MRKCLFFLSTTDSHSVCVSARGMKAREAFSKLGFLQGLRVRIPVSQMPYKAPKDPPMIAPDMLQSRFFEDQTSGDFLKHTGQCGVIEGKDG